MMKLNALSMLMMALLLALFVSNYAANAQLDEEYATGDEDPDFETAQADHEAGFAFAYSGAADRKRGLVLPETYIAPEHAADYAKAVKLEEERKRSHTSSIWDWSGRTSNNAYSGDIVPSVWSQKCGTCVYFSVTGALESVVMRKVPSYNNLYLSKQMLVDSASLDNYDGRCSGWNAGSMYKWMVKKSRRAQGGKTPLSTANPKGRSTDMTGSDSPRKSYNWWCGNRYWPVVKVEGKWVGWLYKRYMSINVKSRTDLKKALVKYGPLSVSIKTSDVIGGLQASGIRNCKKGMSTNHAVLLVGWGNGYFLIKNSWGPDYNSQGGYHQLSNQQSKNSNMCIRKAYVPVVAKVYTENWAYRGSIQEKRLAMQANESYSEVPIDAESLAIFEAAEAAATEEIPERGAADTGPVAEVEQVLAAEDEPLGTGLPLRKLISDSSSLIAFAEKDANDESISNLDQMYTTLTFGPLGNAAFIEAEEISFTISADDVAGYEPMESVMTTVQGKNAMRLGEAYSAFMIEFLPQSSEELAEQQIDITPLKLISVGVVVEVTTVNAASGAEESQSFDLGSWQPVLNFPDLDEPDTDKAVLRHEMCIDEEQRAFLNDLGAVRQIKTTLSVPKVELPQEMIGKDLTFKVHIERFALTTCGALESATGESSDQVALTPEEQAALAAMQEDGFPVEAIVIIVVVLVLLLGVVAMYVLWSRSNSRAQESFSAASARGSRASRSARSARSERASGRGARRHSSRSLVRANTQTGRLHTKQPIAM